MNHVGFNVMCEPDGDGRLRVHISMWLDNQKIADASDTNNIPIMEKPK